jgi:hypothetical protein
MPESGGEFFETEIQEISVASLVAKPGVNGFEYHFEFYGE